MIPAYQTFDIKAVPKIACTAKDVFFLLFFFVKRIWFEVLCNPSSFQLGIQIYNMVYSLFDVINRFAKF